MAGVQFGARAALGVLPAHIAFPANSQAGIWSLAKRDIGNPAADRSQITRAVKRKFKVLQYRPEANDCLAGTGLALDSSARWVAHQRWASTTEVESCWSATVAG
ncbi:hypothetical protein HNQ79_006728 [Streptomyces candidus]|uniref:Transposase n=1 Tax=Streptomyces candidus TaxID=67283 RepID=A0A7X0HM44_9ACTN|nr:hypothetical protein [Streptomyces candidus]MBB6440215.1 hypothetical protein [Streptomyces candidus]